MLCMRCIHTVNVHLGLLSTILRASWKSILETANLIFLLIPSMFCFFAFVCVVMYFS